MKSKGTNFARRDIDFGMCAAYDWAVDPIRSFFREQDHIISNRAPLRVELLEDRNMTGSLLDALLATALLDIDIPRSLAGRDMPMSAATFAAPSRSFDAPSERSLRVFVGSPLSEAARARTSDLNELRPRQTDKSLEMIWGVFGPAVGSGPAFQVARGSEAVPPDATPRRATNSNDPTTPVATPGNSNNSTLSTLSEPGSPDPVPLTPVVTVEATEDAAEPSTDGVFTLSRTGDTTATLTVNYTIGGTATAGDDYTALSGSVTFAASAATVVVAVSVIDDLLPESDETVAVTITDAATYDPGTPNAATLFIADNDLPVAPVGDLDIIASDGTTLAEAKEENPGGWVSVNNDNDNYNFYDLVPGITTLHIYNKDELTKVAGENDLIAIKVSGLSAPNRNPSAF